MENAVYADGWMHARWGFSIKRNPYPIPDIRAGHWLRGWFDYHNVE